MSALDSFRVELRALLGSPALMRRDRSMRALFVCDAPRRLPDASDARRRLEQAGWLTAEEDGLWRVDLAPGRREAWLDSLVPGPAPRDIALRSLCRSIGGGPVPAHSQPWPLIRKTLLLLDAGETRRLYEELRAEVAVLKRLRRPLPLGAAYLIQHTARKEDLSC